MATVLVVDDRAPDRELLVSLIEYAGHRVIEAADGAEALRLVRAEHPDLVISDVLLPKMDGYEFVRQLRADPATAGTAVIFYTAVFDEQEARDLAQECGVTCILSKPTDPEKILAAVAEILRAKGAGEVSPLLDHFEHKHQQLLTGKLIRQADALHQTEERFRLLAEHATDIVFRYRIQPNRAWEYLNPAVTAILGYEPQECYTDPELLFEAVHPDSRAVLENFLGGRSAPDEAIEIRRVHKDGRTVWTETRSTPIHDAEGNVVALEGIIRDITGRKQMEGELREARDELELRVRERTEELAKANQDLKANAARLEMMNQELQEFAFVASHDLQEPLRKIQAFSERIQAKCGDSLSEEACDYFQRMQSAANRMQALLDDLLKYSRVATKPEPFAPNDLNERVREVLADLSVLMEKTGGSVEVSDLPVIESDATQVRQLFQNLISNALKYHGEEKPLIKIHTAGCGDNGCCTIFVEDNGIGFEEKYVDRIFRPFQRLHGRTSPYEGTGMGLAICRKIVERHKGTITAKSTPGKGSTFIVTLPVGQSREDMSGGCSL